MNRPADVVSDTRTFYDLQPPGSDHRADHHARPGRRAAAYLRATSPRPRTPPGTAPARSPTRSRPPPPTTATAAPSTPGTRSAAKPRPSYTMTNGVTTGATATNPLGQSHHHDARPRTAALPLTATDPNGITTTAALRRARPHHRGVEVQPARPAPPPTTPTPTRSAPSTTPTVVTTQTLNDEGGTATSTALYDALLRAAPDPDPHPAGRPADQRDLLRHPRLGDQNQHRLLGPGHHPRRDPDGDRRLPRSHQQTVTAYDGLGRAGAGAVLDNAGPPRPSTTSPTPSTPAIRPSPCRRRRRRHRHGHRRARAHQRTRPVHRRPHRHREHQHAITTVTITGGTTQATDYLFNNVGQQSDVKDAHTGADWNTGYNLLGQAVSKTTRTPAPPPMTYDPDGNLMQIHRRRRQDDLLHLRRAEPQNRRIRRPRHIGSPRATSWPRGSTTTATTPSRAWPTRSGT